MAYKDKNESHYKDSESSNQQWRMSNIVLELESRCKLLEAENKHLNETVHKYKTEYEVETAYLKNKVTNERDLQMQWKNLYFGVHVELTDLKRQNQELRRLNNNNNNNSSSNNNNNNNNNNVKTINENSDNNNNSSWHDSNRSSHLADSGCQECENERKRKESETDLPRLAPAHHSLHQGLGIMTPTGFSLAPLRVSPNENINSENNHSISALYPSPRGPPPPHPPPFTQIISQSMKSPKMQAPSKLYECRVCGTCYDSEQKLHFHMQAHSEYGNPPTSRTRNSSIGDYPESVASIGQSVAGDHYNCPECNQNFTNEDDYRRHLLIHMFKCRACGLVLENETSFVIHMKTHNENIPVFFCFLCDKQFSHVPQLTRHLLSHPDDLIFECVECGKHFNRKAHLTRHMTMHSRCRPYTCKDCGKKFAHKTHLRRHEIVHSGLRPHQCKVCQQSFSRKSSLSRHYFIHTTEKPFVCPVCEKGFNRKGRLRNHLNIHIRQGYPQLADYVIERRPITREFIEKINKVKSDENDNIDYSTMAEIQSSASFVVKREPHEPDIVDDHNVHDSLTSYDGGKDDSEDSSCSDTDDGEIDEVEAELSEEITFDHPESKKSQHQHQLQHYSQKAHTSTAPPAADVLEKQPVVEARDEELTTEPAESQRQQRGRLLPTPSKDSSQRVDTSSQEENIGDSQIYQRRVVSIYSPAMHVQQHPSEEMRLYDRLVPRPHPGENMRVFEDTQKQSSREEN